MRGLPDELYVRFRELLLQCAEFDSDSRLRSVFINEELTALKWELPSASSKAERVDLCVSFLFAKNTYKGNPALLVFLAALRERYQRGDNLRDELSSFYETLSAISGELSKDQESDISSSSGQVVRSKQTPRTEIHKLNNQGLIVTGGTVNFNQPKSLGTYHRLDSKRGMDYRRLENFLSNEELHAADLETGAALLKLAGQAAEQRGYLLSDDMEQLPCTDLQIIEELWLNHSNEHFGFSVQKKIWQEVNGNYEAFGERVGWRVVRTLWVKRGMWWSEKLVKEQQWEWLSHDNLSFNLRAPRGHLPFGRQGNSVIWKIARGQFSSLASRLSDCSTRLL